MNIERKVKDKAVDVKEAKNSLVCPVDRLAFCYIV